MITEAHHRSLESRSAFGHPELPRALSQSLATPVEALRATVELILDEYHPHDPRRSLVRGVLDELVRVGKNVQALMELAEGPIPSPADCTVGEIVGSARLRLRPDQRRRLWVGLEGVREPLFVDAPQLSRCLHRLLENALEASADEVLLTAKSNHSTTTLTVVNQSFGPGLDPSSAVKAFQSDKPNHIGLGLTLVQRDVERMGGNLTLSQSGFGNAFAALSFPRHLAAESAA